MNIGQIKNMSLKLMDEYSLSGVLEGQQLTADYTLKMNTLIDMAQMEIVEHCGIYAVFNINTQTDPPTTTRNGYNFYDLPTDLKRFRYVVVDDYPKPFNDYEVINNQFKLSSGFSNNLVSVNYFKFPVRIDDTTPDTTDLEVDLEAQYIIPYFVAGMCGASSSEDVQLSDKLMAVWATKLNGLTKEEIRYPRRSREVVQW